MAKPKGKVTFNSIECKGCGMCVAACPMSILELNTKVINDKGYSPAQIVEPDKCIACASCAIMCPDSIITVERVE